MKRSRFSLLLVLLLMFGCLIAAQGQSAPAQDDTIYTQAEVDKKAVISRKPRPSTNGQCGQGSRGTVRMEVVLLKTGQVNISRVSQSSGCQVFDKNAYDATMG